MLPNPGGFGRRLLERDRTGGCIVPTGEGEILLGHARRLLGLAAEAQDALLSPGAVARLGVPEGFAVLKLTDLRSGFVRTHPGIRFDTTSGWSAELLWLLDVGDLALIKHDVDDGRRLTRAVARTARGVAGRGMDAAADPLPLALFPKGCFCRCRAVGAVEASGRSW